MVARLPACRTLLPELRPVRGPSRRCNSPRGVELRSIVTPSEVVTSLAASSSGINPLLGLALFFTPGLLILAYATVKGKGNTKDGLSRLLTEVSQGYFQPNVGGENIPVAQGELSDLAGDEPLFKALFQWYVCWCVCVCVCLCVCVSLCLCVCVCDVMQMLYILYSQSFQCLVTCCS
jgi:hypothetical protein